MYFFKISEAFMHSCSHIWRTPVQYPSQYEPSPLLSLHFSYSSHLEIHICYNYVQGVSNTFNATSPTHHHHQIDEWNMILQDPAQCLHLWKSHGDSYRQIPCLSLLCSQRTFPDLWSIPSLSPNRLNCLRAKMVSASLSWLLHIAQSIVWSRVIVSSSITES